MAKSRSGAVKLNFITGLVHEIIVIVFGLILPRIILAYFGSTYNGLINSITYFLSFSMVLRSGLGVVTNAALYKPLAECDTEKISGIMSATDRFMKRVGWLLAVIIFAFALLYPFLVLDEFGYLFSFSLILIIGAASWVENMFSIKYKILLEADQKYYIITIVTVIAYVLSNIFSILLIVLGFGIHIVRGGALLGLLTTPFMLKLYVDRKYTVDWKHSPDDVAIRSRWDAFAQQLATVVNNNFSTILMTILFPLKEISVYTVYHMVVKNINQLITNAFVGIRSTLGNMYAKGEKEHLQKRFHDVEWMIFAGGAVLYSITGILLTPFVLIYTDGIADVDYNRYYFGLLMTFSCYVYITRLPYQLLTEAVGLFKETRNSAFLGIAANIIVSLICAPFMGLNSVVVGTLVSGLIRNGNLIWITVRKVLSIPMWAVVKNYIVYFGFSAILVFFLSKWIGTDKTTLVELAVAAIPVAIIVSVSILIVSVLFNRRQFMGIVKYIRK